MSCNDGPPTLPRKRWRAPHGFQTRHPESHTHAQAVARTRTGAGTPGHGICEAIRQGSSFIFSICDVEVDVEKLGPRFEGTRAVETGPATRPYPRGCCSLACGRRVAWR